MSEFHADAEAWLEDFRESANPQTAEQRWEYLDQAAVHVERLLVRLSELTRERDRQREALRPVPTDEGGPGREETYWLNLKLDAAVRHLRDIEDYYRPRAETLTSYNQARANRARELYEAILEDFTNGKLTKPTRGERLADAEARLSEAAAEIDRLREAKRSQGGMADKIERLAQNLIDCNARSRELAERLSEAAERAQRAEQEARSAKERLTRAEAILGDAASHTVHETGDDACDWHCIAEAKHSAEIYFADLAAAESVSSSPDDTPGGREKAWGDRYAAEAEDPGGV